MKLSLSSLERVAVKTARFLFKFLLQLSSDSNELSTVFSHLIWVYTLGSMIGNMSVLQVLSLIHWVDPFNSHVFLIGED